MLTAVDRVFRAAIAASLAGYLLAGLILAGGIVFLIRRLARRYALYSGKRLLMCPETQGYAAVKLDAAAATITSIFGKPDLRVEACSRWPGREDCGQTCVRQSAASRIVCEITP